MNIHKISQVLLTITLWIILLSLLYTVSRHDYLLFHSIVELFSIVVAFAIFIFAWNSRRFISNNYLLILGIAFLFIGFIDLLHTLSYEGMSILTDYPYVANQLWIAARSMESVTLLSALFFMRKKKEINALLIFIFYSAVTLLLMSSIFYFRNFPVCYVKGQGQTAFKIYSEYVISAVLVATVFLLILKKRDFSHRVFKLLIGSLLFTILSELLFTFYISNYGISNLFGHFSKLASFYLVYLAIVDSGFTRPFDMLFRSLKENEARLEDALEQKNVLLKEIHHRVKNNFAIVISLLRLKANEMGSDPSAKTLTELVTRVDSLARIHEKLYQSDDFVSINYSDHLRETVKLIFHNYNVDPGRIGQTVTVHERVSLNIHKAIPCSLIINELITNSLKYAFPDGRKGNITVELGIDKGWVSIRISDDGVGLPRDFSLEKTPSLGLNLVVSLIRQLKGDMELSSTVGTTFVFRFPAEG